MSVLRPVDVSDQELERKRFQVAFCVIIAIFAILSLRLWYLQLLKGDYYRKLSEHNRIRLEDVPPPRGIIFDRNGEILVDNRPAFNLAIIPEDVKDPDTCLRELAGIPGIDEKKLLEQIGTTRGGPPFRPRVIQRDMTRDQLALVESRRFYLPGVIVQIEAKRGYTRPAFAAHLLGYLGEIEESQLKDPRYRGYKSGDYLGKYGVELEWEKELNGQRGGRQVEVDASGRQLRVLDEVKPLPGHNLVLALDAGLQRKAEELLAGKAGAIVAMDPNNGDILALASSPTFDQNEFVRGFSAKQWQTIVNDPARPLQNKAIQAQYPPGSTFKVVVAAAALEEHEATPDTRLVCYGRYRLGNQTYRCWRKWGHGEIALHEALVRSCDIYFYQLGQKLGVKRMAKYARKFGLGSRTGIRLKNEARGLIPTPAWKLKRFGVPWQGGENLIMAIGQGFVLVTPIQMAVLYSAIANGGKLLRPRVVQRVVSASGETLREISPEIRGSVGVSQSTLEFLQQALVGVVEDPRGTGRAARLPGIQVAGKTGTAQVVKMAKDEKKKEDLEEIPYAFRDHAWFVAYAPAEKAQIVVAVLIEHGGHGGSAAAPLARELMEEFFNSDQRLAHGNQAF
ncbi:MAG: penicillin-binding protein 2 [Deltaproteobacteria bacterium]|nr:penicillin-binding protein 2 [Deltaproteobacteria bacterium]MBW2071740.1 penicillin-binding protein 2 [Deltaproteobacteria bacterium]